MNRFIVLDMLQDYGSDWEILKVQSFWKWGSIRPEDRYSWTTYNNGKLTLKGYIADDRDFLKLISLKRFLEVKWIDIKLDGGVKLEFTEPCRNNWAYILGRAIVSQNIELVCRVLEHRFDNGPLDWNDQGIWIYALKVAIVLGNWDIFYFVAEETIDIGSRRDFYDIMSIARRYGRNKEIMEYLDENRGRLVSVEDC